MKTSYTWLISRRYLLGKKSFQAINMITGIATVGIAIGAGALLLILSVFNGFEDLLRSLYNSIYTDIKVYPMEGKYMYPDPALLDSIRAWPDIAALSLTLEETALLDYDGSQDICTLKGVDDEFRKVTHIDSVLLEGSFVLHQGDAQMAIMGAGIAQRLNVNPENPFESLTIYMPNRHQRGPLDNPFHMKYAYPTGRFSIKQDYDYQYVFVSLALVQELLQDSGMVSGIEIKLNPGADEKKVMAQLAESFDIPVEVRNKDQQNASFYKLMNVEKWISYAVISLTLIIVSFNLISALWMIVLDKKKDISILQAMGAAPREVYSIFMKSGWMICGVGLVLGVGLAVLFYVLQKQYGIVPIPEGFVVDSYPIELRWRDILIVGLTVFVIGSLASWLPAKKASQIAAYIRKE